MASLTSSRSAGLRRPLAGALALLAAAAASAQPTDVSIKAAFLPRFVRYVTWSAGGMPKGGDPYVLCVVGNDSFGSQVDVAASSQIVDGRRIVVRRMDTALGIDVCQVAFVGGGRAGSLIAAIGRKPILTVTDEGSAPGGIINFVIVAGRVRFSIDESLAAQRGLQISSRLLALAVGVRH